MSARRMHVYRTVDGDVLDAIAHRHLGDSGRVHDLLLLNPGLAGQGAVLPAGETVRIPAQSSGSPISVKTLRLWGRT